VTWADGTEVVLGWDANIRFVLKGLISVQTGQTATAICNTETMKAKAVEVTKTPPTPTPTPNPNPYHQHRYHIAHSKGC
jgi:hypothetical protein